MLHCQSYLVVLQSIIWNNFEVSGIIKKGSEVCHNPGGANIFWWLSYIDSHLRITIVMIKKDVLDMRVNRIYKK